MLGFRAIGLERRGMDGSTMDAALTGFRRAAREITEAKNTLTLVKSLDLDPKTREEVATATAVLAKVRGEMELAMEGMKWRASRSG